MWLFRLFGLVLALGGLGVLMVLAYALYTRDNYGLILLVHIGMPAVLLGVLGGAVLVGLGVWLAGFSHPMHRRRRTGV
jgi:hypothetical protein